MPSSDLRSVLYVVPQIQMRYIAEQSVSHSPDLNSSGNADVDMLIAGLRTGRAVQAMTALNDGTVVVALALGRS